MVLSCALSGSGAWAATNESTNVISRGIEKAGEALDLALAGGRFTSEKNPSTATVSQLFALKEGGQFQQSTDFGLNLRLPNLEKRWQLRFSSYDEEEESRDLREQRARTQAHERRPNATVALFKKLGNVKTTFQPRLQLKSPLDLSYVLRFESGVDNRRIHFAPKVELFVDAEKGTGEFASLVLSAQVGARTKLGFINQEEYDQRENHFSTQHGLTLDYALSDSRSAGTGLVMVADNHPYHLASWTYSVSYGQQIIPKRLHYTLAAEWEFAKSNHFKGVAGSSFNLDLTF